MSYFLYSIAFCFFAISTLLYLTRAYWLPRVSGTTSWIYSAIPNTPQIPAFSDASSRVENFFTDAASGLHSSNFDLSSNIEAGDSRGGLDEAGKAEVQRVMRKKRVGFDEARRLVMLERFKREGVGEDGRPKDPRFVSFS